MQLKLTSDAPGKTGAFDAAETTNASETAVSIDTTDAADATDALEATDASDTGDMVISFRNNMHHNATALLYVYKEYGVRVSVYI